MAHVLDNPAWNALNSGNKNLSVGNDQIKYFSKDISPFVGFPQINNINWNLLNKEMPLRQPIAIFAEKEMAIPKPWKLIELFDVLQMVHVHTSNHQPSSGEIRDLKRKDVEQMVTLTGMTHPGPFYERTIEFGHYDGIFDGYKLIAMAGQRLYIQNYTEISAVCTHPDYQGRGYAGMLISYQIMRMEQSGNIPFLHVVADHERTIHLYEKFGFEVRKPFQLYFLEKED